MKSTLLYIAIFFSLPLYGQMSFDDDTVKINEVVISGSKVIVPAGYKKTQFDSTILLKYSNRNICDMLSENTDIFIKTYGMGGTATPSFRGTDASQTLVTWNGININSPMLGQSDLSLIPAGLIDNVQIYFGGASMSLGEGGIGGAINIETKPEWNKETSISVNAGSGSFGQFSGLMKVKTGNDNFQTVTKGYFLNAENNFRYLNTEIALEPVWQTRINSQVRQRGFVQELYLRNSNNVASARVWYQSTDRNLPSSLLTPPNSGEKQFDESLRTLLYYDLYKGTRSISLTGAWFLTRLNYFNRLASIDSRNLSEVLTLKASLENPVGEYAILKIVLDEQSAFIKSNNYNHNITRNTATLTASFDRKKNRIGTTILLREIVDKNTSQLPDFSAGVQFRLIEEKEYFLKANISRNSKLATMNDMYWIPGGNPDLKNEYAFNYEISYEMDKKISNPLNLKYDLSLFQYNIKDMIQWHPGAYSYWTADNIENVNSTGGESSVLLQYVQNNLRASVKADYSYTKTFNGGAGSGNDNSLKKQLMYIPVNQVKAILKIGFKNVYSTLAANFTGKRYISVDNSKYLPGYFINNLSTGIKFKLKDSFIDINFDIDNLFDVNYQSIAYYPLPGRSFFVKIFVQIIK